MSYRREIDGLRAIAVVAVILFHAGLETFSGGFVGVDIFFVISGYLITGIIVKEIENETFSFYLFYERRIRRIIPALYFVILVSFPFSWLTMTSLEFSDYSMSIISVILFSSNFLFWNEGGYFAGPSEEKPLLHTWSLGIEEQFYLFFPIFLLIFLRNKKSASLYIIIFACLISLMYTEIAWRIDASANFYLLPSRMWELLTGSIAAFIVRKNGVRPDNMASILGFFLVLASIFLFKGTLALPRFYSIIPVAGTFLIILHAGERTFVQTILSLKVFVAVGLLSYSAYLWHQPIFSFARLRFVNEPDPNLMIFLGALSIGIGFLSYRFVEKPFRTIGKSQVFSRRFIITSAILSSFLLISLGFFGIFSDSITSRLPSRMDVVTNLRLGDTSDCFNSLDLDDIRSDKTCVIGKIDADPTITLIGDSHAASLTDAFSETLQQLGRSATVFTRRWCPPLQNFETRSAGKNECRKEFDAAFSRILANPKIETIVAYAEWSNYTKGERWNDWNKVAYQFDDEKIGENWLGRIEDNAIHFEKAARYTLGNLIKGGKKVILVLSTPEFEFNVPKLISKNIIFSRNNETIRNTDKTRYMERNLESRKILEKVAKEFNITLVDPLPLFCASGPCEYTAQTGEPLFADDNHLGYIGASRIINELEKLLVK